MQKLDQYEREVADEEVIALNPEARRKAERELDRRDLRNK